MSLRTKVVRVITLLSPKSTLMKVSGLIAWTGIFVSLAFAFNNCSSQPNSPLATPAVSADARSTALYKNEPFAFDAVVDTISYNSCFNDNLSGSSIFGFKVSAAEIPVPGDGARSGIRFTKDFLDFAASKMSPEYPSDVITGEQLKAFTASSPLSGKAEPLIGLRYSNNLSIRPESPTTGSAFSSGVDFFESVRVLTDKTYINDLINTIAFSAQKKVLSYGPRVADFDLAQGTDRNLSVEMGYNLKSTYYELYGNQVRDELNKRNTALTLTFHNGSAADGAVNPLGPDASDLKKAFGKIFYLSFGTVVGAAHNSVPANQLKTVEERDLSKGTLISNASWSCSQFMIVRSQDQSDYCHPMDYSILSAGNSYYKDASGIPITNYEMLKQIRRHYPASNWDVGIFANYATDTTANSALGRPFASHPAIPGVDADADTNIGTGDQIAAHICVVPRQQSCYIPNIVSNVDQGVDYYPTSNTAGCYQVSYANQGGINYGGTVPTKLCAQWASTCVRTSYGY